MQASRDGAVHSKDAHLLLIRSAIGQNSNPWIKVESDTQSRGLIILNESVLAYSPDACRGFNTSVPEPVAKHVGLALSRTEVLAYNSSIEPSTQCDASSYIVHFQSSSFDRQGSQKQVISEEALYALCSDCDLPLTSAFFVLHLLFSRCSTTIGCSDSPSTLVAYPPSSLKGVGGNYTQIFRPCADGVPRSFSDGEFCVSSPPVRFALLLPMSGAWQVGQHIAGAAALAVEKVNGDKDLLSGRRLEYNWADSGCSAEQGLTAMGKLVGSASNSTASNTYAVIGPGCRSVAFGPFLPCTGPQIRVPVGCSFVARAHGPVG